MTARMRRAALLLALAWLVAIPPARASDETLDALLEQGDGLALQAWSRDHPGALFERVQSLLAGVLAARRGEAGHELALYAPILERLVAALPEDPVATWIVAVMAWSDTDVARHDELFAELRSAAAELQAGRPVAVRDWLASAPPGAEPLLAARMTTLARARASAGERGRALELVQDAVTAAAALGDVVTVSWGSAWLGWMTWWDGDVTTAERHYELAVAVQRRLDSPAVTAALLVNLASVRIALGELRGALAAAREAAALATPHELTERLPGILEVQAACLLELGEPQSAVAIALEAEALLPATPDETAARLALLRANALADVGRLESARAAFEHALTLAREEGVKTAAPRLEDEVLMAAGLNLGDLGHTPQALALLERAEQLQREQGDARALAWNAKNRGWILLGAGLPQEAGTAFAAGMAHGTEHDLLPLEGWCALGRAEAGLAMDSVPAAIDDWLDAAEHCARVLQQLHLQSRVLAARGRRAAREGDQERALAHLAAAVEILERLRRRLDAPEMLTHFLRDRTDPYREAALLAARLGRAAEAFLFSEQLRARVLQESRRVLDPDVRPPQPGVATARRAIRDLEASWQRTTEPARREVLGHELQAAEADLDTALLSAELLAPRRASLSGRGQAPLSIESLQRRLQDEDFHLVAFLVHDDELLRFVLRDGRLDLGRVPVGRARLRELVDRLREPMEQLRAGRIDLAHLDFDVPAARELYDLLLRPVADTLGSRVLLVPDGPLCDLPFGALVTAGEVGPVDAARPFAEFLDLRFLAQERVLAYAPGATLLARTSQPRPVDGAGLRAFVAGTGASRLADLVERPGHLGQVEIFAQARATDVSRHAPGARWLHFATHGRFDPEYPLHSHLLLEDGQGGRERLEAWQIERLDLSARLATLSACHTAEGRVLAGEGPLGLTRSVLAAGVAEVVASLWAVEEAATVELMSQLYLEIAAGHEPVEALARARRRLMTSRDPRGFVRAHPYFWAAWVDYRAG